MATKARGRSTRARAWSGTCSWRRSDNIQICQPSTAAQYFHLLRRQAMRHVAQAAGGVYAEEHAAACRMRRRRLRISLRSVSRTCCRTTTVENPRRLLVCSGKIGHNLRVEREQAQGQVRLASSFSSSCIRGRRTEMQAALDSIPSAPEIVWVQEEPANMGALFYVMPQLRRMAGDRAVLSVKRTAVASPATGSAKAHELEEKTLIDLAFGA